ncbi:thermoresistant glucokinase family carbohydrate [Trichuris trichiura]|uniref:Gluconokinase n=1 Tax=Trichuris trichiura TaxID=36087 RepID=A0A077Z2S3_TRITR|nr:thermoresistant glucokinase family carbohydrate [Trichuris trichiura]
MALPAGAVDVSHAISGKGLTLILMGVSGSGKSTIGRALSLKLGIPFLDGDDYHSAFNKAKMCRGEPLSDEERAQWLSIMSRLAQQFHVKQQTVIIGCSALKQQYRQRLVGRREQTTWIFYLHVPLEMAQARLSSRTGHFFKPWLLKSQYEILECPSPNEFHTVTVDASQPITAVVNEICTFLKSLNTTAGEIE